MESPLEENNINFAGLSDIREKESRVSIGGSWRLSSDSLDSTSHKAHNVWSENRQRSQDEVDWEDEHAFKEV
jgi:hypothetical protein